MAAAHDWAVGVPDGSWWQSCHGGTYSFVSLPKSSSRVESKSMNRHIGLGDKGWWPSRDRLSALLDSHFGLQPVGTAVLPTGTQPSSGNRCGCCPSPSWALGTLHMRHLQMRSQRGRSRRHQSCRVGFCWTPSMSLANTCSTAGEHPA